MTAKRKSLWVAERLVPGELSVFPYEEGLSRGAKLFDNFHITKAQRLSPQNVSVRGNHLFQGRNW